EHARVDLAADRQRARRSSGEDLADDEVLLPVGALDERHEEVLELLLGRLRAALAPEPDRHAPRRLGRFEREGLELRRLEREHLADVLPGRDLERAIAPLAVDEQDLV